MKTIMILRSLLSALFGVLVCIAVAGLGFHLLSRTGNNTRMARNHRHQGHIHSIAI